MTAPHAVTFCIAVDETDRLDRFLADQLAFSRTQAARLIAAKRVTADGKPLRASAVLERGTVVTVELPATAAPRTLAPAQADLHFVFEDEHLAVLDKPAGLVVHPGPGHWDDTLVNVLVGRGTALSSGTGESRPGIVHRLDRDTSGLLVVARSDEAHRALQQAIRDRDVTREYLAVVRGRPRSRRGTLRSSRASTSAVSRSSGGFRASCRAADRPPRAGRLRSGKRSAGTGEWGPLSPVGGAGRPVRRLSAAPQIGCRFPR